MLFVELTNLKIFSCLHRDTSSRLSAMMVEDLRSLFLHSEENSLELPSCHKVITPVTLKHSISTYGIDMDLKCTVPPSFPVKLHEMLCDMESNGLDRIVSWLPNGKAFRIHDQDRFISEILPMYWANIKYKSFMRQLNLWSFKRIPRGEPENRGGYRHACFIRDDPILCHSMTRNVKRRKGSSNSLHSESHATPVPHSLFHNNNEQEMNPLKSLLDFVPPQSITGAESNMAPWDLEPRSFRNSIGNPFVRNNEDDDKCPFGGQFFFSVEDPSMAPPSS